MISTTFGNGVSQTEQDGVVEIKLEYGIVYRAMMNEAIIPVVANFLVFYDFDQTIATHHIWEESDGCEVAEFRNLFTKDQLQVFLGGAERVERLRAHFIRLREMGAKLFVVSFGDRLVNSHVLETFGMLQYFEDVYRGRKPSYVKAVMEMFGCNFSQAVFVDDDIRNVKQVGRFCQSMHIPLRKGMTEEDLKTVELLTRMGLGIDIPPENDIIENEEVEKEGVKGDIRAAEAEQVLEALPAEVEPVKNDLKDGEPGVQDPAYWEDKDKRGGAQALQMKNIDVNDSPLG